MTRKVKVEAGRDATVDQSVGKSVGKEAHTVKGKASLIRSVLDDTGKLAILGMVAVMISEVILLGVVILSKVEPPPILNTLLLTTLTILGGVCGAQKINGLKSNRS